MKLRTVIATLLLLAIFAPFVSLPITISQSTSTTMTITQPPSQGQCTTLTVAFSAHAGQMITGTYGSDISLNFYILAPSDLNSFTNCRLDPSVRPLFIEEYSVGHENPYRSLFPKNGTYYFVFVFVRGQTQLTKGYATVELTYPSSIMIVGTTGSVSMTSTVHSLTSTSPVTSLSTSTSTTVPLPQTTTPTTAAATLTSIASSTTESVPPAGIQTQVSSLMLVLAGVTVAVGALVGATLLRNRKRRALSNFLTRIDSTYNEFAVDRQECRTRLERLKRDAIEMLNEGKIEEGHFLMLDEKISEYLEKTTQATSKSKRPLGAEDDRIPAVDAGGATQTATQIKYCNNCGAKLSLDETVCKRCGVAQ